MTALVFDSETDGFLETCTKVHCIAAVDIGTKERFVWGPNEIPAALEKLSTADRLIGQNHLRFDLPVLLKLYGWRPKPGCQLRDTKVISRLKYPNVKDTDRALIQAGTMPAGKDYQGKHTIGAWGYRLGLRKLHEDITDWSQWTQDMQDRCVADTEINVLLWEHLRADGYSQDAIELEQDIDLVVNEMEKAGVPFNMRKAGALHADLIDRKDVVEKQLVEQFGSWLQAISPSPDKYIVTPKVNNKTRGVVAGQPYCKLKLVTFNPGSRDHIARVLLQRGWKPTKFTDGGKPEIDESTVEAIVAQYPEMAGLGEYLMLDKRLSQLVDGNASLIKSTKEDGRIHGVINPMGTTTGRASHFAPNLSQVPSGKKPYGERFRELFEVPPLWVLVGADMDGLEGRVFAHFMHPLDGGAYSTSLLSGDPHWASAKALGFVGPDEVRDKHNQLHVILREGSKRFYYAFIYGAWDRQAGSIILDTVNDARKAGFPETYKAFFGSSEAPGDKLLLKVGGTARENFMRRTPGMDRLLSKLKDQAERGYLPGLDGRRIPVRSEHSALNFLIQGAGAVLCKRWVVDAWQEISAKYQHGWDRDFVFCLWVHDELQVAVRKGLEDEIGTIIVKHAKAAGQRYGFRVPLDSSYTVGQSWADTH